MRSKDKLQKKENKIFEVVLSYIYKKYGRDWVNSLEDADDFFYHTVRKKIAEVLESIDKDLDDYYEEDQLIAQDREYEE